MGRHRNVPKDLAGMSCFIGIPYDKYESALNMKISQQGSRSWKKKWLDLDKSECIDKVKEYLLPIMLRRTKDNVADYPKKEEKIVSCDLNEEEKFLYDKLKEEGEEATKGRRWRHSNLQDRLRNFCIHPSLCIDKIALQNVNEGEKFAWITREDVLRNVDERIVKKINDMESIWNYKCTVCHGVSGTNGVIIKKCGHLFCEGCIKSVSSRKFECPLCHIQFMKVGGFIHLMELFHSPKLSTRHTQEYQEWKEVVNETKEEKFMRLMQKYIKLNQKSTKIKALIEAIEGIQRNHTGDKILIFSNIDDAFEVIAEELTEKGIKYKEYISSMNRTKRKEILDAFGTKRERGFDVLLISSKVASSGLNLQHAANHVIFLDPLSSQAMDDQAIGRCWRLGQNKTVFVYRLIIKGTVEDLNND